MDSNQQPLQPQSTSPTQVSPVSIQKSNKKKIFIIIGIVIAVMLLLFVIIPIVILPIFIPPSTLTTETNEITTLLKSVQSQLGVDKPIKTGAESHTWIVNGKRIRTKGYYFDIYDNKDMLEKYVGEIDTYILAQGFVKNEENTIALHSEKYIESTNEWETKGYEKGSLQCYTYIRIEGGYISFVCGVDLNQPQQQVQQPSPYTSSTNKTLSQKEVEELNKSSVENRMNFIKDFIPGKKFHNDCASGEQGTFNPDGATEVESGNGYTATRDSTVRTKGKWYFKGNNLIIEGAPLSQGEYDSFGFGLGSDNSLVAVAPAVCGLKIGSSFEILQQYP